MPNGRPYQTIIFTTVVLLFGLSLAHLCAQGSWQQQANREGRLEFQTPCTADWETTYENNVNSGPYTNHMMTCRSADELYIIGWTDYLPSFNPDQLAELKANQDNLVKGTGSVLLTSNESTHQGMRALEFTANMKGTQLITSRCVMDGYRPVLLAIITPMSANRADSIRRFLTSLRITGR
jgi:hypothetical protein